MKKALGFIAIAAFLLTSCKKDAGLPEMTFAEKQYDFGTIDPTQKQTHDFTFTNSGTGDLIIKDAKGSCGCTVPDYPKEAIAPGGTGTIKVSFDPKGKHGKMRKTVTLMTNTKEGNEQLVIRCLIPDTTGINPNTPSE